MTISAEYDVIIVGGSYAGLSAAMALGRSLRSVLVIDGGQPCNRFTPHAHNLITQDGAAPGAIASLAREQVLAYPAVAWHNGLAVGATRTGEGFVITTAQGDAFRCKRLLLAMGVKDMLPDIPGFAECWGHTVIHCPFCHGYEVHGQKTAVYGRGDMAMHRLHMLRNWSAHLSLLSNGPAELDTTQRALLEQHGIEVVEKEIARLEHEEGKLQAVVFSDGQALGMPVMYANIATELPGDLHRQLGCELTPEGLIQVDGMQAASAAQVYAAGDCTTPMRTLSFAIAGGTRAGIVILNSLLEPW